MVNQRSGSTRTTWTLGVFTLLAGLLLAANARAEFETYEIDPEHLTMAFLVDHAGYAKVLGMFGEASGSFEFDEDTGALANVRIVAQTNSVFTNHEKRDEHLRSDDFFDASSFPEMVFTAASARATGPRTYQIPGELSLLGVTQPLTLDAIWNKSAKYPIGFPLGKPYVMGVSARGSLKRSAHGMSYALDLVGDEIELIIEFEAKRR